MEAPPGGPVDSKHPFVAAVFPAPDTTRVSSELKVQVAFSEWVGADVERGKVYLNPPLPTKLKVKLSGNLLEVTSKSRLDTNTTYLLGVLGSVKDLNGLSLESPLELVFSTGPTLDSGRISGRVAPFQSKPSPNVFVALYPRDLIFRERFLHLTKRGDSAVKPEPQPTPSKEKPTYLSPADSIGRFAFRSIKPGRYAMLGFQDINGNLTPDIGSEALAIGPTVEVTQTLEAKSLSLFAYDTVPLKLMEAKWISDKITPGALSEGSLRLKFNRNPHPLLSGVRETYKLRKASAASDSKKAVSIPVLEICTHPVTGEVELRTAPLEVDSQYVLSCPGLKDASGNSMDSARSSATFRISKATDTTHPELIVFGPRKVNGDQEKLGPDHLIPSRGLAAYYPRLLSDSTFADLKIRFGAKADTTPLALTLIRVNHHEFAIQISTLALKGQRLQFILKPSSTDKPAVIKSLVDSSHKGRLEQKDTTKLAQIAPPPQPITVASFSIADATKLGSLKFQQQPNAYGSKLILRSLSSPAEFSRPTPPSQEFVWDSLPEGWYAVDYFRDANGDGIWNPGSVSPWSVQEPYVMWADSIEVKPGGMSSAKHKLAWPPTW